MSLINVLNISFQAGTKKLFDNLSFSIEPGDRIGLVGHNGCGKSSLLSLLLNRQTPDDGRIQIQRGLKVGSVEQFVPEGLAELTMLDSLLDTIEFDERLSRKYEAETLLYSLGFSNDQFKQKMAELSGGQKSLILFARAIIKEPELILLDEPGNHMDVSAMNALKQFLSQPQVPAFLMISHDRDLLDSVTNRTLWLRDERCYSFALPYSLARLALADQDEAAAKTRASEEKQIDKLKVSAKRLATWGKVYDNEDLARKAKTMEKRVDKLEANKTFISQGTGLSLSVDTELLRSKQLFTFENERITAPDGRLLYAIDELVFRPGDRIALLGINGSGKSSCIKSLLANSEKDIGQQTTTRFNPNVRIGYFDQELELFDQPISIFDWLLEHSHAQADDITQTLIHWGFAYRDHSRLVNRLSGGERARLVLLGFQLEQPNLLIMDEPTNHIDLQGKEQLEQELMADGLSLLLTSHDKLFIERVATRYWLIEAGQLKEIHDLNDFYRSLDTTIHDSLNNHPNRDTSIDSVARPRNNNSSTSVAGEDTGSTTNEELLLERVYQLETLLTEDKARKKKFQKPKKQQQWQNELEELLGQL
ncbi:ABC-F family ATP-binding cassette domain-containing protein [Reinekea thalattae]|uniref:ABC-F family ATP-binding cassette domain-containing protein n=1 Tax=Reinekea thalattae TaxID=2593301 RepID=A0A5C8Z3K5_9GAMM|nr:ATP-binding cassette domain-containing protein [Reinekea thalattae]TXR52127.1 ABC-F family ATP-binding cassette domain-containing protein [Reinekea thalattae]